ncbi:MAG: MBL fold metallo-hydrolase [Desulfurococcales archaeon]|nr:MBL fold metallo-hydrolase [Desulfurococcales archaeon]
MTQIKIRILGGGREVGRAAVAVGSDGKYVLLDYGINFDEKDIPQLPLHIRPNELVAVTISHAHLDHVGALPMLYTSAKIPAVMTRVTRELSKIMLSDFLKISGYYLPYEQVDVEVMLDNTIDLYYDAEASFGEYVIKLINAGHIPGSAMTLVEVGGTRILYTGDVNTIDTRLVKGAFLDDIKADILITEGTYGNSIHPDREEIEKEFVESIREVIDEGGNVLIPAFSLGRSQEILLLLYEKLRWANVYYDGMIRVINDILVSHPEYLNKYDLLVRALREFRMVRNSGERRKIVKSEGNIIVSSAGMLKGGPAVYYLKKLMNDPNSAVFLVSYQGPTTPGRSLLENGYLTEGGEQVRARVQWFDFSSHAGADGLIKLVKSVRGLSKVILVHSEEETGLVFKEKLQEILSGVDVYFPVNGDELLIDLN